MNRLGIYMSTDYTESQIVVERFVVIENDWIDLSAMSSPLASPGCPEEMHQTSWGR